MNIVTTAVKSLTKRGIILFLLLVISHVAMSDTYEITDQNLSNPQHVIYPTGFPATFSGVLTKTRLGTSSAVYSSINFVSPASGSYKVSLLSEQISGFAECIYNVRVAICNPERELAAIYSGSSETVTFERGVRYTVLITSYYVSGLPFANTNYSFDLTIGGGSVASYTVSYDPGLYGTGSRQTSTKTQNVALTLHGAIFTRTGYTQTGWSTRDGGDKVYDLNGSYTANSAITLYPFWTRDTTPESTLLSIYITGPSSVLCNGSATYSCVATMSDRTTKQVTPTWTITSGGMYASITSSGGLLTANNFATYPQSVTIAASYVENGVAQTATYTVTVEASVPSTKPDLSPSYTPDDWSSPLVVASSAYSTSSTVTTFYETDNLYLSWACLCSDASASETFRSVLYIDGVYTSYWDTHGLDKGCYTWVKGFSIGTLPVGNHTIKMVYDHDSAVLESNESNNTVTRSITIIAQNYSPSFSQTSATVGASGGTGSFTITWPSSSVSCQISLPIESWVTKSHTQQALSGSTLIKVSYTVEPNESAIQRSAFIPITINGVSYVFTITQSAASNPHLECKHDGGTYVRGSFSPTCTANGYTGDEVCNACGEVVRKGSQIAALGHVEGAGTVEDDKILYRCIRCGLELRSENVGPVFNVDSNGILTQVELNGCTDVSIPAMVKSIGDFALYGCADIMSVTIPDSVETIGFGAFYGCSGLASVVIPDSVTYLGDAAFCGCSKLSRVVFQGNAPTLGDGHVGAFNGVAEDCVAVVSRKSTGWGADMSATWAGLDLEYAGLSTIVLHKNDGTGGEYVMDVECGMNTALPGGAKDLKWAPRRGFRFMGWSTGGKSKVVTFKDKENVKDVLKVGETLDVYAIWQLDTAKSYAIQYIRNDGSGMVRTIGFNYGEQQKLNSVAALGFARRGYTFVGWATSTEDARNKKVWKPDMGMVSTAAEPGKLLQIYAIWTLTPGYYTIRFNKNDGSGAWRELGYEYGKNTTLPTIENGLGWTRPGYTFVGWRTKTEIDKGGTKIWLKDKGVTKTPIAAGKTLSIYAIWEPVSYGSAVCAGEGRIDGETPAPVVKTVQAIAYFEDGDSQTVEVRIESDGLTVVEFGGSAYCGYVGNGIGELLGPDGSLLLVVIAVD